jgi:hypothetical protein
MLRDEHGYQGPVDLVRRRLAGLRPREERAAQDLEGYREVISLVRVRVQGLVGPHTTVRFGTRPR